MDKINKQLRSINMSNIHSENTIPELLVRHKLFNLGYRYRLHFKTVGKPDIVFPSKKLAIFINGCFWHGHGCIEDHKPNTNKKFWLNKIQNNKIRSSYVVHQLKDLGWGVVILWECDIKSALDKQILIIKQYLQSVK